MANDVTTHEFIRFLNATRTTSTCGGCGKSPSKWGLCSNAWAGNEEAVENPLMESLFHRFRKVREEDGKPYGFSTFAMFCQNCGHVEHVYQPMVMAWIAENSPKDTTNG